MKMIFFSLIFVCLTMSSCTYSVKDIKDTTHKDFNQEKADFRYVSISKKPSSYYKTGYWDGRSGKDCGNVNVVDPNVIVRGILVKKGYTDVSVITDEIMDKTLLVRHSPASERYVVFFGEALDVNIEIVAAKTAKPVFECTAEGRGPGADIFVRDAITRCLDAFPVASASSSAKGERTQPLNRKESASDLKAPAGSPFSRIKVGMSLNHVQDLIGLPSDGRQYPTGKEVIPIYQNFGSDLTRMEMAYKGQGRITYTGNPWTVDQIINDPTEPGYLDHTED